MYNIRSIDETTSVVLLPSVKNYSTINMAKDGGVVYHPGINENFNCFERTHWTPMCMFLTENNSENLETIQYNDIIIGRSNNISSLSLEVMKVTSVLPISGSVCCDGIWTDGSACKVLASNVLQSADCTGKEFSFDFREHGGEERVRLLEEDEIKRYLTLFNEKTQ